MRSYFGFNVVCLFFISFALGGNFWLWKDKLLAHTAPAPTVPEALSFDTFNKNPSPLSPTSTSSPNFSSVASSSPSTVTSTSTSPTPAKEIPKEINLAVPFSSQAPEKNWDQPWQDACEEAAVLMLDAYYKKQTLSVLFSKDEILKMVKWEEEIKKWGRSIEIEKIEELVKYYSKSTKTKIVENPTIEQIKQYVAAGTPVYVVADGKVLPNPHFLNGGPEYHALIIRGYTETEFITNDPGTQFGENFKYKYNDLMKSIRDWNGGSVKTGRRIVLVME